MKERASRVLVGIFITVLGLLLVALPFHAFISTWGGTAVGPLLVWKSWKELLLLALVPLVITYLFLQPEVWRILWGRWVNKLALVYLCIHIIWAFLSPAGMNAVLAGLAFNLRFIAVFILAQIVVASGAPLVHKLKKFVSPWLLVVTIVISILAAIQTMFLPADFLAQFGYNKDTTIAPYILVDENKDALRAFATMRGPNELGSFLMLPLLLALALVIDERRNVLAGVALGLGVIALGLTGSRSAWLGVIAALVVLAALWLPKKKLTKIIMWGTIPAVFLGAFVFWLAATVPEVRLAVFHSSPGDPSLFEGSNQKHWEATYNGVKDVAGHPLGQGVGVAGPASYYGNSPKIAENYFVQIAQEVGIIGMLTFLAINVLLAVQLFKQRHELMAKLLIASLAGMTVVNVFLHGWVDDPTAITWWLVAGLYTFAPHNHKRSNIKSK